MKTHTHLIPASAGMLKHAPGFHIGITLLDRCHRNLLRFDLSLVPALSRYYDEQSTRQIALVPIIGVPSDFGGHCLYIGQSCTLRRYLLGRPSPLRRSPRGPLPLLPIAIAIALAATFGLALIGRTNIHSHTSLPECVMALCRSLTVKVVR